MLDAIQVSVAVVLVVVVCHYGAGMRALTSITIGAVAGWIFSAVLLKIGGLEEFDSDRLAGRRMLYSVTSTAALLLLLIHLAAAAGRECNRAYRSRPRGIKWMRGWQRI